MAEHKYAYVTLLTNDSYFPGVVILQESLRRVNSEYPLICLVNSNVTEQTLANLDKVGIAHKLVENLDMPKNLVEFNKLHDERMAGIWKDCFTKFYAFEMTEYEKVIFCDADLLILKNVDDCFEKPHMTAAVDGEYSNFWPSEPHFNAGFMVIEPKDGFVNDIKDFINNLDLATTGVNRVIADQEILNLYYKDWANDLKLHLSKYYNIFPNCSPAKDEEDVIENGYFIHFIGVKPWSLADFGLINEKLSAVVSIFSNESSVDSYCWKPYELAYCIFWLSLNNGFAPLNWVSLELSGKFYIALAQICLTIFKDMHSATYYCDKALAANANSDEFNTAYNELSQIKRVCKYLPIIREMLSTAYECNTAGMDNLGYFSAMRLLRPIINTDGSDRIVPYSMSAFDVFTPIVDKLESEMAAVATKLAKPYKDE